MVNLVWSIFARRGRRSSLGRHRRQPATEAFRCLKAYKKSYFFDSI